MRASLRIAFVIPNLGPGGAERVASLLCNDLAGQGQEVTLLTFEEEGAEPFFPLHAAIGVRRLAASDFSGAMTKRLSTNIARLLRLKMALKELRTDAVVAFMTEANVLALLASRGLSLPVVISERNQPDRPGLGRMHKLARRLTYPLASAIVVQTQDIADWVESRFRVPVHVIPNPVAQEPTSDENAPAREPLIVSVGRLTQQKGFDVLIESFAALAEKHRDWRLTIYGEGPQRAWLTQLAEARGMGQKVSLPGITKDIPGALRRASLFVSASRYEGYPNALVEALAAGLPIIATDCPGASAEILADGLKGMLVPPDNAAALANSLDQMISSREMRAAYAGRTAEAVAALDLRSIGQRWLDLLASLKP
jgi:glycosyltransferase involved in cell wall biosynthesis